MSVPLSVDCGDLVFLVHAVDLPDDLRAVGDLELAVVELLAHGVLDLLRRRVVGDLHDQPVLDPRGLDVLDGELHGVSTPSITSTRACTSTGAPTIRLSLRFTPSMIGSAHRL